MRRIQTILFVMLMLLSSVSNAKVLYPFSNPHQRQQFVTLTNEIRCLVCQNESIAASNAKLAADLRGEVYRMVLQGQSDQQIKAYLVRRYGDFVLFKPPVMKRTYVLWFGPFVLLLLALAVTFFVVNKHRILKTRDLVE